MRYVIQKSVTVPAYLQLYKQIREDIVVGIYAYHSKLPSKRMMADELGLSTLTVEHAYALLIEEGYIEPRERSGYFVIFRSDAGFAGTGSVQAKVVPPITPSESVMPEFPFSVLAKTMRGVISEGEKKVLARSPNAGCIEFREAIRQYLARSRGLLADTEQIIIGSGAEYLYSLIVELLGRHRIYALESPSYKKIEQVYRASDVLYVMLPLGHDGIHSTALWQAKADVLHISPYRSFPSGVTATASKRHEYLRWAAQAERYIVEDDFESEFSVSKKAEETLFSHAQNDNVIYMNTFSQTISPSLRVGYMVLPKHLVAVFEEKLGFYSCTVPTYIQFVLTDLLMNGDFERHINRVRRKKRKEMQERS